MCGTAPRPAAVFENKQSPELFAGSECFRCPNQWKFMDQHKNVLTKEVAQPTWYSLFVSLNIGQHRSWLDPNSSREKHHLFFCSLENSQNVAQSKWTTYTCTYGDHWPWGCHMSKPMLIDTLKFACQSHVQAIHTALSATFPATARNAAIWGAGNLVFYHVLLKSGHIPGARIPVSSREIDEKSLCASTHKWPWGKLQAQRGLNPSSKVTAMLDPGLVWSSYLLDLKTKTTISPNEHPLVDECC